MPFIKILINFYAIAINSIIFSAVCTTTIFNPEPGVEHQALKIVDPAGEQEVLFDMTWGGSIVSLKYLGQEYIWGVKSGGLLQLAIHHCTNSDCSLDYNPTQAGDWYNGATVLGAACNPTPLARIDTGTLDFSRNSTGLCVSFGVFGGNIELNPAGYFTPYAIQCIVTFVPNPRGTPQYYLKIDQTITNISDSFTQGNENYAWGFDLACYAPYSFANYAMDPQCTQTNKCNANETPYLIGGMYQDTQLTHGIAIYTSPQIYWNTYNSKLFVGQTSDNINQNQSTHIMAANQAIPPGGFKKFIWYVLVGSWANASQFAKCFINPPNPTISGINPSCDSALLSTQSFQSYQWKRNGSIISGATNQNYLATQSGSYTVQVSNDQGCIKESPEFNLTIYYTPPRVGDTLMLLKNGSNLEFHWQNISGATSYTVYRDTSPSGNFSIVVGNSTSGTTGLTIPMPIGTKIYFLVAAKNNICEGPKK
ncbi:MAG: hypothetical protein WHV67_03505 [Thermoanaerobaculia bacterium]